ncbi:MAG TPA: sulfotransferase [Streptosporangiaceae bacterium]|nr:sulfotransferase [Streptosporangiaceae bacterium]
MNVSDKTQVRAGAATGGVKRESQPRPGDGTRRRAGARSPLDRVRESVSIPRPVRRAVLSLAVRARRPAGRARMLPGFLIVGAQRCGTTSLTRTLSEHPAVSCALLHKEVHYFDTGYRHGIGWYRSHFPLLARARQAAPDGTEPVAFESSPYYMFHPLAAERIHRDLPGVKLLVLLRDPVERTYSAHAHEVAHGYEKESYERALDLEETRLRGEAERIVAEPGYNSYSHQHHSYRARGEYVEQLERLEVVFGRDRMLVIDSGDFFADPEPTYHEVLDFIGLPLGPEPGFKRRNARPRSAPMSRSIRAELEEHYRPHDERLAKWLGREPSWRR